MLKKINKIKNFGIFKDFHWDSTLSEFSKFNLFYGWNYSGKTTLSRIFRCFENNCCHSDYSSSEFELEDSSGTKFNHSFSNSINIRVFNSDFIKDNIKWDSNNIEPILIIGEENAKLQEELKIKLERQETLIAENNSLNQLSTEKSSSLETLLTNKSRDVGNLLSLRPFTKTQFKPIVDLIKSEHTQYYIEPEQFENIKSVAISTEQKPILDPVNIKITSLSEFQSEIQPILQKQAVAEDKINELLTDKILSDWVEKGKDIHKEKERCGFCGNILPENLLERLNKHFSQDFENLKQTVESNLKNLERLIIKDSSFIPINLALYSEYHAELNTIRTNITQGIESYNQSLMIVINDLKNKKDKPFDCIDTNTISDNTSELNENIEKLNLLIQKSNNRTIEFEDKKNEAKEVLKKHFASEFIQDNNYQGLLDELSTYSEKIELNSKELTQLQSEITEIQTKLSDIVKGSEKVNDYLKVFFGKDDIQIIPNLENKFQLFRDNIVASNFSEGEKTAISFAYFMTKLEEKNNELADTIVFIDDPVSSLDSNHLFNIYSFIKSTFYRLNFGIGEKHIINCKQLFLSTHSFEFYNLIFDWFDSMKNSDYSIFLIERTGNTESVIKGSNKLLEKYKSEYAYLFSIIYDYKQNSTSTNHNIYNLPNIMRRFLEIYLHFKYLSAKKIDESIDLLVPDKIKCERLRKFVHYYSHSLTTDKLIKFPDLSEAKDAVDILIDAVSLHDSIHYDSLVKTVNQASSAT